MQLKDYQTDVLEALSRWLGVAAAKRAVAEELVEFHRSRGRNEPLEDYCRQAWEALHAENALPLARGAGGERMAPPHVSRTDGCGRFVPNVCLKVPTGGGKTLLGTAAVERINAEYFRRQTGLVLWIVPSDAIYRQTWNALANREHPYRQTLERASAGRVKLLERGDSFSKQDVEQHLCVMLLMLQASARRTKETLKMFQDSGKYPSFFPEVDDVLANRALREQVRNLDVNDLTDEGFRLDGLTVRQSLGNVLRIERPLVVIDEGHKAYSEIALETLAGFNPRMILELSATPNSGRHQSNVLVNVPGTALKAEQMIKMPLNLVNEGRADWKHTLAASKEQLDDLQREADRLRGNEGRYIRPILLVRVERTGNDQRDKAAIHSEDVREYLRDKLGADPEQIRVKSAERDELGDEDLLSERSAVRYVITKDALREGWDCPFAYVLAVLSKTTALTALTQMVGRVLRQPHAKATGVAALDECYVYTFDQDVQEAVVSVRQGLQEEGMGDLADGVRAAGPGAGDGPARKTIRRRKEFESLKIFLPQVLSKHPRTGAWRPFDYDRDLLSRLDWGAFSFTARDEFTPDHNARIERSLSRVSVEDLHDPDEPELAAVETVALEVEPELDRPALIRLLLDVIPNPWQGARILDETLAAIRARGVDERRLYTNRLFLVKAMKDDLRRQVDEAAEAEFRRMLVGGDLSFRLEAAGDATLNWELAETFEIDLLPDDRVLARRDGLPLERSLFQPLYEKQFNPLERDVALYLDGEQAVRWWHRIAVLQRDWHLQGWQRSRVYPDLLACLVDHGDGKLRFAVLETKGEHLKGNDDTDYKRRLFELLTEHSATALPVGELQLDVAQQQLRFELMLEESWRQRLPLALGATASRS